MNKSKKTGSQTKDTNKKGSAAPAAAKNNNKKIAVPTGSQAAQNKSKNRTGGSSPKKSGLEPDKSPHLGITIDNGTPSHNMKQNEGKISRVTPQHLQVQGSEQDRQKSKTILKLFQGKKALISRKMSKINEQNGGALFVREFLEKMSRSKNKSKNATEVKICKTKVDRVDRLRGITIIYPKYIIPVKSRFKVMWEIIVLTLIIYIAIFVPFQIGFDFQMDVLKTIEYMIIAFFIVDIFISMRTSFLNEDGDEILEGKKIFFHYVKSVNFAVDIISAIPIAEFFDDGSKEIRLINLVKILRLLRLARLLKLLQSDKVKYFALFFKSFFAFMLVLHWITCLWFLILHGDYNKNSANFVNTWVPSNIRAIAESSNTDDDQEVIKFYEQSKSYQYIFSLYSITMLILGGEISPVNGIQSLTLSISCITGQTSLAILFANMSILIFKMNQKSAEYVKHLESIQNQLETHDLQAELKSRVLEYFQFCWRKKKIFQPELSNFQDLSTTLERESLLIIHQEIVANVPLFSGLEMAELLGIIQKLQTYIFMPNECISRTNDVSNDMYFISEGVIEQITAVQDQRKKSIQKMNRASLLLIQQQNSVQKLTDPDADDQVQEEPVGNLIDIQNQNNDKEININTQINNFENAEFPSIPYHKTGDGNSNVQTPQAKVPLIKIGDQRENDIQSLRDHQEINHTNNSHRSKDSASQNKYDSKKNIQKAIANDNYHFTQKTLKKDDRKSVQQFKDMMFGSMQFVDENDKETKLLKKGDYFLELSLINSMRVESDYTASVFCIIERFSRKDYIQLKKEFPGIEQRLQKGMEVYKQKQKLNMAQILIKMDVFQDFSIEELEYLYLDYMQDHYLEPDQIILYQNQTIQQMHFIIKGSVNYSHQIIHNKDDQHQDFLTIDDDIEYIHEKGITQYNESLLLKEILTLIKGQYFGFLNTESLIKTKIVCKNFYLTKEPTHVLTLNENIFEKLTLNEQYLIRDKLRFNLKNIEQKQHAPNNNIDDFLVQEFFIRTAVVQGNYMPDSSDEEHIHTPMHIRKKSEKEKTLKKENLKDPKKVNKNLTKMINKMLKQQQQFLGSMQKRTKDYKDLYYDYQD